MKPILYSYWRSSCSWRVRIALELKKIDYEYRAVPLDVRDQHKEDYKKYKELNPMNQVPTFILNGVTLTQSMAILEFLEEIYPQVKILPTDISKRAKVREICEVINAGIQPLQNPSVMNKHSQVQEEKVAWCHFWIKKGLTAVEELGNVHVLDQQGFSTEFLTGFSTGSSTGFSTGFSMGNQTLCF